MKKEFLKNFKVGDQALPDEVIDAILAEHSRDIEAAKKPYADYDHIKSQLEEAQKAIEGFKSQDIEGVRKSAQEWQDKYNQALKDHEAELANMAFDRALDGAITTAKGRNAKAIKALLDVDTLKASKKRLPFRENPCGSRFLLFIRTAERVDQHKHTVNHINGWR